MYTRITHNQLETEIKKRKYNNEMQSLSPSKNEIKIAINDEYIEDDGDQTSHQINPLFNDYYAVVDYSIQSVNTPTVPDSNTNLKVYIPIVCECSLITFSRYIYIYICIKQDNQPQTHQQQYHQHKHKPTTTRPKIVNNHLFGGLLGDGSYGKVKECLDLCNLSRRAVKIMNLKMIAKKIPNGVENVQKEINIMKRLNNRNLIKLYDYYEKSSNKL